MTIHHIEEAMPHFTISSPKGVHVVPVETVCKLANGSLPLFNKEQLDDDVDLLRGIIEDWLVQVHGIDPNSD